MTIRMSEHLSAIHVILLIFMFSNEIFTFDYPKARRNESVIENHFGIEVKDPYRWLEKYDSDETKQFIEEQNKVTFPYIENCPHRKEISKSLTELNNYRKITPPRKYGSKYYFYRNSGLEDRSILYVKDSLYGNERVFLDPNKLTPDGSASLSFTSFSHDGSYCAYGMSIDGTDWIIIKIRNVETGIDLNETITKIKFSSPGWTYDNEGFFYSKYDEYTGKGKGSESELVLNEKLYYHRINTDESQDKIIAKLPDPRWRFNRPQVTNDGKYLHVYPVEGTIDNIWYYARLNGFKDSYSLRLTPIIEEFNAEFEVLDNDGDIHYVITNWKAPKYKILAVNLSDHTDPKNWIDLIPEDPDKTISACSLIHTNLILIVYSVNVIHKLQFYRFVSRTAVEKIDYENNLLNAQFVAVKYLVGKKDDPEMFLTTSSLLTPTTIFYYNFNTTPPLIKVFDEVKINDFDGTQYLTEQVFVKSKDGVRIPMFILHHKDLAIDGTHPAYLYGYGGFASSIRLSFSIRQIFLIRNLKAVYAIAAIRGGSEYGEDWHTDGMLLKKQNVFNDFIAAAEYLIDNRYTNRDKLIIHGRSNGGLLIGAVCNQRPELFGCAIPQVGVMDMIRYHKFTIGYAWISEYGDPNNETQFKNLIKYSPLHNIPSNATRFPATLILTADHDDRVVPSHSLKYAAQLQHSLGTKLKDTPLMIRIDTKSGHGSGLSTSKFIEEITDIFSFIINSLDLQYYHSFAYQLMFSLKLLSLSLIISFSFTLL